MAQDTEIAHEMGIRSNCTMLFGHVEEPKHIIDHLIKVRQLQRKTGGFITFIPLKFSLDNTELEQKGLIDKESSSLYDLKVIALSRLMLATTMKNISVYWVALGKKLVSGRTILWRERFSWYCIFRRNLQGRWQIHGNIDSRISIFD